jgi:hypothetical protein
MNVSFIYHIKEESLRLTKKVVLRKIFGPKRGGYQEVRGSYIMRDLTACVLVTC